MSLENFVNECRLVWAHFIYLCIRTYVCVYAAYTHPDSCAFLFTYVSAHTRSALEQTNNADIRPRALDFTKC